MVKKKVVVLGHNGFVGKNTIKKLKANKNYEVIGISKSTDFDMGDELKFEEALNRLNPDYIVNCAAHVGSLNYVTQLAGKVIYDNTRIISSLYKSVAKFNPSIKIINPIANCAYPGKVRESYIENEFYNGEIHESVFAYGSTRRLLLAFAKAFEIQYGINSTNLLVPNMYGPFDSTDPNKAHALNSLISKFVKASNEDRDSITIWGTGKVIREWLFSDDWARIVEDVIESKFVPNINPINIAQNDGLTIKALAEIINSYFENRFELLYDTSMPDGAPKKVMDDRNFRSSTHDFKFVEFSEGIRRTVEYYKSVYPF